ncbi:unnamed protein product [Rotaria sp. Silwood1]|nr:unnamed protein product [Rotaria sp. Silwood1]
MVHPSTLYRRRKRLQQVLCIDTNERSGSQNNVQQHVLTTNSLSSSGLNSSSKNDDENEWFNMDEEDINYNSSDTFKLDEFVSSKLTATPKEKEIAAALILLKGRHKLSNTCIKHICYLLRSLKVPNVPKSYSRIFRIFHHETESKEKSTMMNICNECNKTCTNAIKCDNIVCSQHKCFENAPLQFLYMPILPQIRNILARTEHLNFERQDQSIYSTNNMKDITDAAAYDRILSQQSRTKFISLLMNIDGVRIAKSSNTSIWIVSFVINELKRNERFQMKNVITAGVSYGKNKPSRDQMYIMLTPIVQELQQLEYGRYFNLKALNNNLEPLRIFLLAACLDKPAQAIVQNLGEPIGAYGCGRCELVGETVYTDVESNHKIRVFPLLPKRQTQPRLRSNFTHDEIINIDENDKPADEDELRDMMRGHVGPCVLRPLKYFDVGSLLLFGFMAFKSCLSTIYYNHFLLLVIGTHLIESRSINQEQVELIQVLYEKFLRLFSVLYTSRHNVQSVHSLHHFSASVKECGSSSNYSTFNFESFLGILTGSIHATRRYSTDIENNIRVLREACITFDQPGFNLSLHKFLNNMQRTKRTIIFDSRSETVKHHVRVHTRDTDSIALKHIQQSINNNKIDLFKTCHIGSNRFTTLSDNKTSTFTDSCILFTINDTLRLGFIRHIIRVNCIKQCSYLCQVQLVTIDSYLDININGDVVPCKNVLFGNLDPLNSYVYIKFEEIIEKIIHVFDKQSKRFIFFRFPNLVESS